MPRPDPGVPVEYAVICGPEDGSAIWVAGELRARGLDVRLVTTEELVYSPHLTHTVSASAVEARVLLADGSVLGPGLRGTLNRVVRIPAGHLSATPEPDRGYLLQELQAVLTSLLHGLPGTMVGRPSARGLCGAWWSPAEWMVEAGRVGLTGVGYRSGGSDPLPPNVVRSILVVAGVVIEPDGLRLPPPVRVGCLRLAERHGSGMVGIDLAEVDAQWVFTGGTPWPDLRGDRFGVVAALVEAFTATPRVPVPV